MRAAAAALMGIAIGMAGFALADEPRLLPPLTTLTTLSALDGNPVGATTIAKPGRWLFVYVRPQSGPSRSLMTALEQARGGRPATVVIVVGSDAARARAFADGFEKLAAASWYADARGDAFRALTLTGVPVVLGMQENAIHWSLAGVVPDRRTLPSVLGSW